MIYVGLCLHTPPSLSFYAHLVLGDRWPKMVSVVRNLIFTSLGGDMNRVLCTLDVPRCKRICAGNLLVQPACCLLQFG